MLITATRIPDVKLIQPEVFGDSRGFFMESWNARAFAEVGISADFVQDNHSLSVRHTLRGLHYQLDEPQGKLVRCSRGEVFDVAVDLRMGAPPVFSGSGPICLVTTKPKFGFLRALLMAFLCSVMSQRSSISAPNSILRLRSSVSTGLIPS